jgi:hypothetical protein
MNNSNATPCGQGLICVTGNNYGTGSVCALPCTADQQCPSGQGCLAVNQANGSGGGSFVFACQPNTSCTNNACGSNGTTCQNGMCRNTCTIGMGGGPGTGMCPTDETCVPTCPSCFSGVCSPNGSGGEGGPGGGDAGPTLAPMPTALTDMACIAGSDGKIYVFGGADAMHGASNDVWAYDPAANTWAQHTNMPTARYGLGVAQGQANGIFYLAGGFTSPTAATGATEQFNAFSGGGGTWMALQSMPTPLGGSAVEGIGAFLVAGGAASENGAPVAKVQSFQLGSNSWNGTSTPGLQVPRKWMGSANANGGGMFAMGGFDASGQPSSVVERFDNTMWSTVMPMPTARAKLATSTGPNAVIAVLGGTDGTKVLGSFETYDQASNGWSMLAAMPTPREGLCAAFVGNGSMQRLYAIGGDSLNGSAMTVLAVVEAFDWASMTWVR